MNPTITSDGHRLIRHYDGETLWIEPWGKNSLRVRITMMPEMPNQDWALMPPKETIIQIQHDGLQGSITNGNITAKINKFGFLQFENTQGELLLKELWQDRQDENNRMSLFVPGRELKGLLGGLYKATVQFQSNGKERIYGLGQHQEPFLDLKGCELELAQRNSQVSIPFMLSNLGYGFFWNNPAYGRVTFAKNKTLWTADVTTIIDYWVTANKSLPENLKMYTEVTGRAPRIPEFATGFWQSKLRYNNQEELMDVAREYKRRNLPISVIVVDFFHWPQQGEWCFDPKYWPNPKVMVEELRKMGIELMVSIWPTVDPRSSNYAEMKQKGFLVKTERGSRTQLNCLGAEVFFDATNPEARHYIWKKIKENYYEYGIRMFWLDEAEPEYIPYDYDNIRYYIGPNMQTGGVYPAMYAKALFDGQREAGQTEIINLVRSAWAGSQRYGVAVWSGDIHSNFETLRTQVRAGLNIALSGIPWWTTDIGGFFGGDPSNSSFIELFIRWFQYGTFCPICRLHGYRKPTGESEENEDTGLFDFTTCGPNEVWSYGSEAYEIIRDLLHLREKLRPYIMKQMDIAHENGTPPMRPLFFDFPNDKETWNVEDSFMFGPDILVAPVLYEGARVRSVYLPEGNSWEDVVSKQVYDGGQYIECDAPLSKIPIFCRFGAKLPF